MAVSYTIADCENIAPWWWRDTNGIIEGRPGQLFAVVRCGGDLIVLAPIDAQEDPERWRPFFSDEEDAIGNCDYLRKQFVAEHHCQPESCSDEFWRMLIEGGGEYRRYEFDYDLSFWNPGKLGLRKILPSSVTLEAPAKKAIAPMPPETVDVSFIRAMLVGGKDDGALRSNLRKAAELGVWISPIYTINKGIPAVLPEGVQLVLSYEEMRNDRQHQRAADLAKANGVPIATIGFARFKPTLQTALYRLKLTPVTRKALVSEAEKGAYPRLHSAAGADPEIYGADRRIGFDPKIMGDPVFGEGDVELAGEDPDGWPDDGAPPSSDQPSTAVDNGVAVLAVATPLIAILLGRR